MQTLLQTADGTDKPRYRAACDACRQSKVRCSGNGVCLRCKKHDYKCRYSIAHRAGKPKGSKNKATLKKLENLQAGQENPPSCGKVASTRTTLKVPADSSISQQRKRRKNIPSHHARARYDIAYPLQDQSRNASSHAMSRKYAFSSPAIVYPSPTSPGTEPCFWEDPRMTTTEMGVYGPIEASYGQHMPSSSSSSTLVQYMPSPRVEPFKARGSQPEFVVICGCFDRLALTQKQLYNLGLDSTMWQFDSTVDLVTTSLSSCHIFLNCMSCPKHAGNLSVMVSLLDHTFDVLNRLLFHRSTRNNSPDVWGVQQYHQSIPYDYALALQDCILEQAVTTAYQIVNSLKEIAETEIANNNGGGPPLEHINNDMSSSDFSSPASVPAIELSTPEPYNTGSNSSSNSTSTSSNKGLIIGGQNEFGNRIPSSFQQMHSFECSPIIATATTATATAIKPSNNLTSVDVNHLLRVIHHYETILGNLQALVTRNNAASASASAAAAAAQQASTPVSWSMDIPETRQDEQYHGFQQQQQHPRFSSYDAIGLS